MDQTQSCVYNNYMYGVMCIVWLCNSYISLHAAMAAGENCEDRMDTAQDSTVVPPVATVAKCLRYIYP